MNKLKEQYTEQEKQKLVEITKYFGFGEASHAAGDPDSARFDALLKEEGGDENIGRNPVFNGAGVDRIGGSILRFLLETVLTLTNRLEQANQTNRELRSRLETDATDTRNTALNIAKVCEAIPVTDDLRKCSDMLGQLLYQPEDLSLESFAKPTQRIRKPLGPFRRY